MEAKSKIPSIPILAQGQRSMLLATGLLQQVDALPALLHSTIQIGFEISAIKAFGPKLTSCKRGHGGSFGRYYIHA